MAVDGQGRASAGCEEPGDDARLVPGHCFHLSAERAVDRARFLRLFRETWSALPAPAAERILQHWYRVAAGPPRQGAVVRLATDFPWTRDPRARNPAAATHPPGDCIDFLERYLEALSPRSARALIAHELAHVYLQALGGDQAAAAVGDETRAYELETEWGFDVRRLRAEKARLQVPYVPVLAWRIYGAVGSFINALRGRRQ